MERGLKLLLVEDDVTMRRAMARLFEAQFPGCAVAECGDGTEAVRLLTGGGFDCAFLDYRLPGLDGLEVLHAARSAGAVTPIVVLTGEGSEELAVEMMKAGATDYLVKGRVTPDLLGRVVRHAVRLREAEARAAAARAEQAASEERFRRLVEVAEDGVWVLDADGRTTFLNAGAAALIGYRPEEIVGRSPLDFIVDEASRASTRSGIQRRQQGFRERRECVMRHRDGSPVWVIVAAAPLTGPGGEYAGAFATLTDVTRQKQTERALRESEERFRKVFEDGPVGMAMTGLDRRFIATNAAFGRLVGRDPASLAGTSFDAITHPDDVAPNAELVDRVRRGEASAYRFDKRYVRPDGTVVWAALTSSVMRDPGGRPPYLVTIVEDITERRRAEAELRASAARFRSLFEASPLAISLSAGETTLYVNPAYLRMFGYDRVDEVVGHPITERIAPSCRREVMGRLARQESAGGAVQDAYEAVGLRRDGSEFPYHVSVARMEVPEGMANLAFISDLTEQKRAEAKQRESEERFRRLFEASPVAIEVSVRGVTQYANPAFLRTFGYERVEQVIGHSVLDHVAPSAREMIADRVVRRERGEPVPDAYETVGLRQDGSEFPFHIRMARLQMAEGVAHLGFITDLTEQKRAEAGLKASEARFRSLFELSPLAIELSVDGVTLYANPAYLRMFGFDRVDEVIGSRVVSRVAPSVQPAIADRMARRDRGERVPDAYETIGVRRDGAEFPLHVRVTRMTIDEGMAHLAFIADLTGQKQAEAALIETSRTLAGVFAASPLAMAVLDRAGYVRMWNPAAERIFGWSEEDVTGRMFPLVTAADDPDQFDDLHARLLSGQAFEGIEGAVRRNGGAMVDISASAAPLKGADGSVSGIVVVCADMTEANRLRGQLVQAQKMESLGRLAGGIAHDFNNLLAVIGGYAESVRRRVGEGHAARPQVEEIERAAERGARLVKQLLAFSRSKPPAVRPEAVDVSAVVGEVCQMLRQVIGQKVVIERRGAGEPAWVEADAGQVEQILVNLALNARDAMPGGGTLTFETSHLDVPAVAGSHPAGRFVALVARDTGTGMDASTRARLFEPFYTTKAEGTGLGLAIVYGVVQQLGGHISVHSEPEKGTRFEILLPAVANGQG